ncbi:carboxypeptidase M32 [Pollutibacter soli]|uniref:carboxypeptidase M32 n=1 Tax=Pollutibacter soli TaxID=3034157 RepID=UPI00301366FA
MKPDTAQKYSRYVDYMQKIADIRSASAVLQWDQETYLPPGGAMARGRQIATLSELAHSHFSAPELGDLLTELTEAEGLTAGQKKNIAINLDDYNRNRRYSSAFVRKLSEQINQSFHAWLEARKKNDFSVFKAELAGLIELKKEESHIIGFSKHLYDAHLDEHDRGLTVEVTDRLFTDLKKILSNVLPELIQQDDETSGVNFAMAKDDQWKLGMEILGLMGFSFDYGRQDISEHPFTISFHPTDVRLTTRINPDNFSGMLWSCIHEGGHGLYEQGLNPEEAGLPLGEACSLSIHESQSRLWENCVGRSFAFCSFLLEKLKKHHPAQFGSVNAERFFRSVNQVKPTLIRTESDEVTYHYHILIRYEMEKDLLTGDLSVKDIPARWNQLYKEYLGLDVPDDKQGCLQDVHWSHGSFGYFPTYTLGSMYGIQFFDEYKSGNPQWEKEISAGEFGNIRNWLKSNVYNYGKFYNSLELCNISTQHPLELGRFANYLENKFKILTASIL